MFKKFKDRLNEVSEEVKKDPRFQNSLASVNRLAENTLSTLNRDKSDDNLSSKDENNLPPLNRANVAMSGNTDQFFSIGDDDESLLTPDHENVSPTKHLPYQEDQPATLAVSSMMAGSPVPTSSNRNRRLSSGSQTSEQGGSGTPLFPIYEAPQQMYSLPQTDLDSTAGSEWEDGNSSAQLSAISKEQLFQMLQKTRARYHKYKGRYADVAKAYTDLENENDKVKNIMQQTQDKALRRISELREQCQLEQKAKRHLEEELRSDIEEKEHIIQVLQTKVSLLKSKGTNQADEQQSQNESDLIDLECSETTTKNSDNDQESKKAAALEEKIRRLESLLTKCKESIKANKQKTQALTEVKESLSSQLSEREAEIEDMKKKLSDFEIWKQKAREEELQIAETKMVMHQEIINKDEEIGKVRSNLKHCQEDLDSSRNKISALKEEIDQLKKNQDSVEKSAHKQKDQEIEELQKKLQTDHENQMKDLEEKHSTSVEHLKKVSQQELDEKLKVAESDKERELRLKDEEFGKKLLETQQESRLSIEELEMRLASMSNNEGNKNSLLQDLESRVKASNVAKTELEKSLSESNEKVKRLEGLVEGLESEKSTAEQNANQEIQNLRRHLEESSGKVLELNEQLENAVKTDKEWSDSKLKYEEEIHNLAEKFKENQEKLNSITKKNSSTEEKLNQTIKQLENKLNEVASRHSLDKETWIAKTADLEEENRKHKNDLVNFAEKVKQLGKDLDDKNDLLTKQSEEHRNSLTALRDQISKGESNAVQLKISAENHELAIKEKVDEISKLEKQVEMGREKLEVAEAKLERAGNELMRAKESFDNLQKSNSDVNTKLQEVERKFNLLSEDKERVLSEKEAVIENLTHQMEKVQEEKLKSELKILELEKAENENLGAIKDLERELTSLAEREKSQKDLHLQMIDYEKELQERIKNSEDSNKNLSKEIESLRQDLDARDHDVIELKKAIAEENTKLQRDLEMRIRLEQEKETSYKDLQSQSIEYQKRLQEQLEEKEDLLNTANETIATSKMSQEVEIKNLLYRISELTETVTNLEASKQNEIEGLESVIENVRSELKGKTELCANTEAKLTSLEDDKNSLESLLKERDENIDELSEKVNTLTTQLDDQLQNVSEIQASKSESDEKCVDLQKQIEKNQKEINELNDQFVATSDELTLQQSHLSKLKSSMNDSESVLLHQVEEIKEKADEKCHELELKLEESRNLSNSLQKQVDDVKQSVKTRHDDEISKLQAEIEDVTNETSSLKLVISMKEKLISDLQTEKQSLSQDLDTLSQSNNKCQEGYKQQLMQMSEKLKALQDTIDQQDKKLNAREESDKEEQDSNLKRVIKDFELQLAKIKEENEVETSRLREKFEGEMGCQQLESRERISSLEHDLYEKTTLYEDLLERHDHELGQAKQELEEEVESCNRMYQAKLAEVESQHVAKLKEQERQLTEKIAWGDWNSEDVEDLQSPATLALQNSNNINHMSVGGHPIEEATEFEYLKNILYQYMLGKEPVTLGKVLATVVKFSPEQVKNIESHALKRQSVLSSFGLNS